MRATLRLLVVEFSWGGFWLRPVLHSSAVSLLREVAPRNVTRISPCSRPADRPVSAIQASSVNLYIDR